MPPTSILITGSSSGLGLAFLRHYYSLSPSPKIYTLDISPPPSDSPKVMHHFSFDISDPDLPDTLISYFSSTGAGDAPPELVIHSAGIRGLEPDIIIRSGRTEDVRDAETWDALTSATMTRTFEVNCVGTMNLLYALGMLVSEHEHAPLTKVKVVIMGSRMGSLSLNNSSNIKGGAGGGYAYRASKAALNAVVRSFVIDVPELNIVIVHPGRVETRLVRDKVGIEGEGTVVKEEGALQVDEVVSGGEERGLVGLIERLGEEDSGRFVDRWGKDIPW
ncbi:MAG: hypothetical protein Q9160_008955 [Pyrenula sp. 1 TL-2023]